MRHINSAMRVITLTACLLMVFCGAGTAENLVLVLNKNISEAKIDKDEVRKIFLGDKIKWDDNSTIVLAVLNEGNAIHDVFLKSFVGRSSSQFSATWKKLLFTGKGAPPTVFNDLPSMLDYISKTKNAVGYATTATKTPEQVKTVNVN